MTNRFSSKFRLFLSIIIIIFLLSNITYIKNPSSFDDTKVTASSIWIQKTKSDFENGNLINLTFTPTGSLKLTRKKGSVFDNFYNDSQISSKQNIFLNDEKGELALSRINEIIGGYGGDDGKSVQQTTDGGYIITGSTSSYGVGDNNIWLIKTDEVGDIQWHKTFSLSDHDSGNYVQQTYDNGYIIIGTTRETTPSPNDNVVLIKTDNLGNESWNRTFGGIQSDIAEACLQTSDNGYIIICKTNSYSVADYNARLIKTNSQGIELWNKTFGGAENDVCEDIQITSDNGFIIVGSTLSYGSGGRDVWLIKTDSNGDMQWNHTYGGILDDLGYSVQQSSDGGYILTGRTKSYGSGNNDVWVIKTNSTGFIQWDKTFGGSDYDVGESIKQFDNHYIIIGTTASYGAGEDDLWLIRINETGKKIWDKTFGGTSWDRGKDMQINSENDIIFIGNTMSYGFGIENIWFIKTDAHGNITSNGELISKNLLTEQEVSSIDGLQYIATISTDTSLKIQFSQDNTNWYNSENKKNNWDLLIDGENSIDLSNLNWKGAYFYYKLNFESNGFNKVALQNIETFFTKLYCPTGIFESKPFYSDGNINWKSIEWTSDEPPYTYIKCQLRTADSENNLKTKKYSGPDGTSSTYYTNSGSNIWSGHDGNNWIQYKIYFIGNDRNQTPELLETIINYNLVPPKPILVGPSNNSWSNDNKPPFFWEFYDLDSNIQSKYQWQADNNLDFNSIEYDSGIITSKETTFKPSFSISEGTWYWRVRTQDSGGDWSSYSNPHTLVLDTKIAKPSNLTVNPSNWTSSNLFNISWKNPKDFSGIMGVYYSIDTPPQSNLDGTYLYGVNINSIENITIKDEGMHLIYIWLIDGVGNVNYLNYSVGKLLYDKSPPSSPINIKVEPSNWTSINYFKINWTNPEDHSGIKNGAYYYIGKMPPTSENNGTWMNNKPLIIQNASEGENNIYIWLEDDLGQNIYLNHKYVTIKLDTKPPVIEHIPVSNGTKGEDILIEAKVIDEDSGVDKVILYYKKFLDVNYTEIEMNKNGDEFLWKITKENISSKGMSYYLKAIDLSTPNNLIYYSKSGITNIQPTYENNLEIIIEKDNKIKNESDNNWILLIISFLIIIIILIIFISIFILKKKGKKKFLP